MSQRLQELGKVLAPDAATAIVISGRDRRRGSTTGSPLSASGKHRLRGRGEPIEVFLVGDVSGAAALARPAVTKIAKDV